MFFKIESFPFTSPYADAWWVVHIFLNMFLLYTLMCIAHVTPVMKYKEVEIAKEVIRSDGW